MNRDVAPTELCLRKDTISTIMSSLRDFNNVLKQSQNAMTKNPQLPQLGFLLLYDTTDNSQLPQLSKPKTNYNRISIELHPRRNTHRPYQKPYYVLTT